MDIDLSALRDIEREKEIPFSYLISTLESALLNAYEKSSGAHPGARVEIDRKSGQVRVLAPELDDEGNKIGEHDDTPDGFGRSELGVVLTKASKGVPIGTARNRSTVGKLIDLLK